MGLKEQEVSSINTGRNPNSETEFTTKAWLLIMAYIMGTFHEKTRLRKHCSHIA
jgi:hypothetical protein